jgi:hypothetical protein
VKGFDTRARRQQRWSIERGAILCAIARYNKKEPSDLFDLANPQPISLSSTCSYSLGAKGIS